MTAWPGSGHADADHVADPRPALPPDLAGVMPTVLGPGGEFRHRQHVHLAFIAVRRYGTARAPAVMTGWIRHFAAYQRAPQKYHATMTMAWTELVARHAAASPAVTDFAVFAALHPALLDKRLLSRHYSSGLLASAGARAGWVPPDLSPFPWPTGRHPVQTSAASSASYQQCGSALRHPAESEG
jgi:hypothetical protein